jgi:hypothetical protein
MKLVKSTALLVLAGATVALINGSLSATEAPRTATKVAHHKATHHKAAVKQHVTPTTVAPTTYTGTNNYSAPTTYTAPVTYTGPTTYTAPTTYAGPTTYTAPAAHVATTTTPRPASSKPATKTVVRVITKTVTVQPHRKPTHQTAPHKVHHHPVARPIYIVKTPGVLYSLAISGGTVGGGQINLFGTSGYASVAGTTVSSAQSMPLSSLVQEWNGSPLVAKVPVIVRVSGGPSYIVEVSSPSYDANQGLMKFTYSPWNFNEPISARLLALAGPHFKRGAPYAFGGGYVYLTVPSQSVTNGCALVTYSVCANVNLFQANLSGLTLSHVQFTQGNLDQANMDSTKLDHANLSGAQALLSNMNYATLDGATLTNGLFGQAMAQNASFKNINADGLNLTSANLTGSSFQSAVLANAILNQVNATSTDFSNADLMNAAIAHGQFNNANFSNTNLAGANLSFADFSSTNLTGANLAGANLYGASFNGAVLIGAQFSATTECPDGNMAATKPNCGFQTSTTSPVAGN